MELDFSWNRSPGHWGYSGRLAIHDLKNLDSVMQVDALRKIPEVALALPFLSDLASIDFSGELPLSKGESAEWTFRCEDLDGKEYGVDVDVDSSEDPWNLNVSLSPIEIPLDQVLSYAPSEWLPIIEDGECNLLEFKASGSWGDWEDWQTAMKLSLGVGELRTASRGRLLRGGKLVLEGNGTWPDWKGNASLIADEVTVGGLSKPLSGIEATALTFSLSVEKKSLDVSGPWKIAEGPGGASSGALSFSTGKGYRVQGKSDDLDLASLGYALEGKWSGEFTVQGDSRFEMFPSVTAGIECKSFRRGKFDFSARPVSIGLKGYPQSDGSFSLEDLSVAWGEAFQLEMSDCQLGADRFRVGDAELTGDLQTLSELVAKDNRKAWWWKWIDPKGWKIKGGFNGRFAPTLSFETESARLDTGKGQGGSISFAYSGETSKWTFQSWPLDFDLRDLVSEFGIPRLQISGRTTIQAGLEGRVSGEDFLGGGWSARIQSKIRDSEGRVRGPGTAGSQGESLFGWKGLSGSIGIDWDTRTKKITTDLSCQDWVWFTKPPAIAKEYTQYLWTPGVRLKSLVTQESNNEYAIREFVFSQGEDAPINLSLSGSVKKQGSRWIPDLKVQMEGHRAKPTPVFRAVQLGGSGVFVGTVRGNARGNWVLDGDLACDGISFEFVVGPVILEDVRGKFPIQDVRLDELVSEERWRSREHASPKPPVTTNAVTRAFEVSRSAATNISISHATFGDTRYRQLDARTHLVGEHLYLNTLLGYFPQGDYPFYATGFLSFRPRRGAGWRIRGETNRVPLHVAVPGFGGIGLDHDAVAVDFYLYRNPIERNIETRYISIEIPVGQLKEDPRSWKVSVWLDSRFSQ